ncbi:MAG: hypothetical protein LBK96_06225 [Prevotellaceae bacterium]|jgi:hypothetical protein|nr:hypothetical protein [Prevotellaceae bacterium]
MSKKKHARKKKYVNPVEQQKLQEAQYRNFFMEKLQNLCTQIGGETLFQQIPPLDRSFLYMLRGAPLKIVTAEGLKVQKRMMDALVKIIKSSQASMKLEVVKGSGQMITFADYLLVGMALEYHACQTISNYPGKERFAKFAEMRYEREEAYEKGIESICTQACCFFDDIGNKYLHTYKLETAISASDSDNTSSTREIAKFMKQDFRLHQKIIIGAYPLEIRKVSVNGETHSAIQVGLVFYSAESQPKLHHFKLSPDEMHVNMNSHFSKLGLPVYVQQHALDRMKERLGLVLPAFNTIILIGALIRKEIISIAKNRALIACFASELKIGYLLAEITDSVILIRTFLLLTNGGTPEGDKLSQLSGLQTEDRKYLSIDTLQGLANSDITQNETICKLFRDAGCGSILELCEKISTDNDMMYLLDKSSPKNIISDLITEYMNPGDD